jgi:hypothetical protein
MHAGQWLDRWTLRLCPRVWAPPALHIVHDAMLPCQLSRYVSQIDLDFAFVHPTCATAITVFGSSSGHLSSIEKRRSLSGTPDVYTTKYEDQRRFCSLLNYDYKI